MLDASDKNTLYSLRQLRDCSRLTSKPVLYWIGAGASAWCGYPLWGELAGQFHRTFLRSESLYDRKEATDRLERREYPALFELCKKANPKRYSVELVRAFGSRDPTPVYSRFIDIMRNINPLYAVTTNVDECLEHNITSACTVQRSNLERCVNLLQQRTSFVGKLHGTISAIETVVFTSQDYIACVDNQAYLSLLQHVFAECSVLFLGYSLSDQYVLSLLSRNNDLRRLFGDGPHFLIASEPPRDLPESIRVIRYKPAPHTDHRTVLQVLEVVNYSRQVPVAGPSPSTDARGDLQLVSANFISDIYPPGTWTTSSSATLDRHGAPFLMIAGLGWSDDDKPSDQSTAMHDLLVSLLCFDLTYVPFSCAQRVHDLLGSAAFWELVKSGAVRFLYWEYEENVIYSDPEGMSGGMLGSYRLLNKGEIDFSVREMIRRSFAAVPGKEDEAEHLFKLLEGKTDFMGGSKEPQILETIKGLLLLPHVRQELGLSDGTPTESLPRWVAAPILRFANIVKMGMTCQDLSLASTKLIFSATHLAEQAFSAVAGGAWADNAASYVLSGRFNTDLGSYLLADRSIITAVLRFRETQEAASLRRAVKDQLAVHAGSEVVVSINAGLRACVPPKILDQARNQMSGLLIAQSAIPQITPAIWNDHGDDATAHWRRKSAGELKKYCEKAHIGPYSLCPCGSGEKFRFCCEEALRT